MLPELSRYEAQLKSVSETVGGMFRERLPACESRRWRQCSALRVVHATVGIRPARKKPAARSPTVAWTL